MKKNLFTVRSRKWLALGCMAAFPTFAQNLEKEKFIDISGKAARGSLGNVVVDDAKQQLDLVFVTKSTNKKVKFEVYQFNYDLELVNQFADEQEMEHAKTKWKWFNFKGEEYSVTGLSAAPDMFGNATFKKKEVTYSWNWFKLGYSKSVKTLEKLKPKTEDGKKMFFYGAYELDDRGEILALVGEKGKNSEPQKPYTDYAVLRVNSDVDIVNKTQIHFDNVQYPLWSGQIENGDVDSEDYQGDYGIIFVPAGGTGINKYKGGKPDEYTFVRIGLDGNVKYQTKFTSKGNFWKISGVVEKGNSVIMYGPSKAKDVSEDFFTVGDQGKIALETKFSHIQVVNITDGKVGFVSLASNEEFEQKSKKPSNQPKASVYDGKKVYIGGMKIAKNGDLFIMAQDFKNGKDNVVIYQDIFVFHFGADGTLKSSYSIDQEGKHGGLVGGGLTDARTYPMKSDFLPTSDGKSFVLILKEPIFVQTESYTTSTTKTTYYWPRYQVKGAKIDVGNATISEVKTFGNGTYYLFDDKANSLAAINEGKQVIFLGEGRKEKKIWLGKFDPDKF